MLIVCNALYSDNNLWKKHGLPDCTAVHIDLFRYDANMMYTTLCKVHEDNIINIQWKILVICAYDRECDVNQCPCQENSWSNSMCAYGTDVKTDSLNLKPSIMFRTSLSFFLSVLHPLSISLGYVQCLSQFKIKPCLGLLNKCAWQCLLTSTLMILILYASHVPW